MASEPHIEKIRGMSAGQFAVGLGLGRHMRLHEKLMLCSDLDSPEADAIRDQMESAWRERIAEAQQRLNASKDGDVVQIDLDLEPYINRTET